MGNALQNAAYGAGCSLVFTTSMVCTFFGRKARRREGDKCFFCQIFF